MSETFNSAFTFPARFNYDVTTTPPYWHLVNANGHADRDLTAAYKTMLESCYACHKASSKPYLRPMVPTAPASTLINFDPNATWPQ